MSSTEIPVRTNEADMKLVELVVEERWLEAKRNGRQKKTNRLGLTMLHIAVIEGRNYFLERLLDLFKDGDGFMKTRTEENDHKRTALHHAAVFNNKRAAQLLVKKCRDLLSCSDSKGLLPVEVAHNNGNLDTFLFLWEATDLLSQTTNNIDRAQARIREEINFDIVNDAISREQYDIASRLVKLFPKVATNNDRLLMAMARTFPSDLDFLEALIYPSPNNFHERLVKRCSSLFDAPRVLCAWADYVYWKARSCKEAMWFLQELVFVFLFVPVAILYPIYQLIRLLILSILYPFFILYFLLWTVLAIPEMRIKRIKMKRKKYQEAKELVNLICNTINNNHSLYKEPFKTAVCHGAYEVVDEILYRSPNLIKEKYEDQDYTFIELAITERSEKIFNLIYHLHKRMDKYRTFRDPKNNNILHLAGKMAPARKLCRSRGAALQLQRELQWFQEVKKLMLPQDIWELNKDVTERTPKMVFTDAHKDLVKEGEIWMKTTSEACSITAALIVTIVFAAAITVPGGNNQETGTPLFKKEIAFIIFQVCDAISLVSAVSALLVFLSILTTRFTEDDFLLILPTRLVIGLSALFLSTASMMVTFTAILLLVVCDQRLWMVAICGLTCMPIVFVIFTLQLPLVVDLFRSTYISIFGKQEYIASGKFISNHLPYYLWENNTNTTNVEGRDMQAGTSTSNQNPTDAVIQISTSTTDNSEV